MQRCPKWIVMILGILLVLGICLTLYTMIAGALVETGVLERENEEIRVSQNTVLNPKEMQSELLTMSAEDYEIVCETATSMVEEAKNFSSTYCIENSNSELLDVDSLLWQYSYGELYFAYYEIYARYGVIFGEPVLDAYFGAKGWYQPTMSIQEFVDDNSIVMNDYEIENKDMIYWAFSILYQDIEDAQNNE